MLYEEWDEENKQENNRQWDIAKWLSYYLIRR